MDTPAGCVTACDLFYRCVTRHHDDDWHEFTRRYERLVRTLVRKTLIRLDVEPLPQESDECLQELYLRLLCFDGWSFRGTTERELWHFLARMIWNLAIDRLRRAERRSAIEAVAAPNLQWMAPPDVSPEERVMGNQLIDLFFAHCRRAANGFRAALKVRVMGLAFFDGMSSREIARRLAGRVTPRQVDVIVFHLRRRLALDGLEIPRRRAVAVSCDRHGGLYPSIDRTLTADASKV